LKASFSLLVSKLTYLLWVSHFLCLLPS